MKKKGYRKAEPIMKNINENETVMEQYGTSVKLRTRISIHEKYSVNKQGWGNWIFSHYDLPPVGKILELGCGTGEMWKEKIDLLGEDTELFLTDISEGMISAANDTLGQHKNLSYMTADIENLSFDDRSFDRVIANMMLYHVPNLEKGLSEVQRVLKDNGYFYCATFGENGIIPYISGLLKDYGVSDCTNKVFTLQNGGEILKRHFSEVARYDYEDSLEVTDIEDILDYIYSMKGMLNIADLQRNKVGELLQKHMINGVLRIPKEYGMFVCGK